MRISTGMIYEAGLASMQKRTGTLLRTQQQLAEGRRILRPSDDPVAAARALEVTQAQNVNTNQAAARENAKGALSLMDSQLQAAGDLMIRVRELAVQGGDAALSDTDRRAIADELRVRFDEMVALANSRDGTGLYLFGGYQTNNQPFAGSVENGVTYGGDDGARMLRVSGSRELPVSESGNDLFMRVKSGNGVFVTGAQDQKPANGSTATIDKGVVTDPVKWDSPANSQNLEARFWIDTTNVMGGGAGVTYYDLVDGDTGDSLFTGAPSASGAAGSYTHAYTSGAPIPLSSAAPVPFDFGANVTVTGTPVDGDAFTIEGSDDPVFGNGYFVTAAKTATALNTGTGIIGAGEVLDISKWNHPANSRNLEVRFWEDTATQPATLYYDLVDVETEKSLFSNTTSTAGGGGNTFTHKFVSGDPISFSGLNVPDAGPPPTVATDFGISVSINGTPASGDSFKVQASRSESVFETMSSLIIGLETGAPPGTVGNTYLSNKLSEALTSIGQIEENFLKARAAIGTRLVEVDDLDGVGDNIDLQYSETLSSLQDLDYAEAITRLTRQQTELQAAQQSFARISQLSLFDYL